MDRLFGAGLPLGILAPEDRAAARQAALVNAGLSLMASGGPSPRPFNMGEALQGALAAGQSGYQGRGAGALLERTTRKAEDKEAAVQAMFAKLGLRGDEPPEVMYGRLQRAMFGALALGDQEGAKSISEVLKSMAGMFRETEPKIPQFEPGLSTETGPLGKAGVNVYYRKVQPSLQNPSGLEETGVRVKESMSGFYQGANLDFREQEAIGRATDKFGDDTSRTFKAATMMSSAIRMAPQAIGGDGVAQIFMMYGFIKGADDESTVRDSEVRLVDLAHSLRDRLTKAAAKYTVDIGSESTLRRDVMAMKPEVMRRFKADVLGPLAVEDVARALQELHGNSLKVIERRRRPYRKLYMGGRGPIHMTQEEFDEYFPAMESTPEPLPTRTNRMRQP
jgi:hypothetical protein